jgi:general stress protein 26
MYEFATYRVGCKLQAASAARRYDRERVYDMMPRVASLLALAAVAVASDAMWLAAAQPSSPPARAAILTAARTIIANARYATFVTLDERGVPQARIVDPFPPENELTLWVATNARSRKAGQIARDSRVTLTYFDRNAQHYVTVLGSAVLVRDLAARAARWKDEWAPFYPKGFRGDDYLLIRVDPNRIEVVAPELGMTNDPVTWRPVTLDLR